MEARKPKHNFLAGVCFLLLILVGSYFAIFDDVCARARNQRGTGLPPHLNDTLTNAACAEPRMHALDSTVESYLKYWKIEGASLAISRGDSLLYCKGYGMADTLTGARMEPYTLLRLASVSKLVTATGIMLLCERDSLTLDAKVFGEDGILSGMHTLSSEKRYADITVRQLLRHEGGFSTARGDPMFPGFLYKDRQQVLSRVLSRPLGFTPGERSDYSNFGYLLLSIIIEEITGEPYEQWMQENVLRPAGCYDFHMAANTYAEKYPTEASYSQYGSNNICVLEGAGAWVASVPELSRFIASIDGLDGVTDILEASSVEEMTQPTDSVTYGLGWNDIKPDGGEWTRTGTLAGTTALIKFYPDTRECWIMVTNSGTWKGPRFSKYTAGLFRRCRELYSPLLPRRDLFTLEFQPDAGRTSRY